MRLLRSMLFTPGNNRRMIQKVGTLGADAVILDLEDAVPMAEKETARALVKDSVGQVAAGGSQVFVRVNALITGLTTEDLRWVIQSGLTGVVLPKTESGQDVLEVVRLIDESERERGSEPGSLALMPQIETATGVLDAREIATASKRIIALNFGSLDFTRDMGTTPSLEGTEVFYARSYIAVVARAARVVAIDTPWIDIADRQGLIEEAKMARQLGFQGKLLIHPSQIEPVHQVFSPSEDEVAYARRVVEAFREAEAQGVGAISLDGRMIDVANARQAQELIARAEATARRKTSMQ
jgi:citrate lyase subunit beta/citryl-CoA lyase